VIDAVAGIHGQLTVAGAGPERERLEARARQHGLEARFAGFVDRERACGTLYREAWVVCARRAAARGSPTWCSRRSRTAGQAAPASRLRLRPRPRWWSLTPTRTTSASWRTWTRSTTAAPPAPEPIGGRRTQPPRRAGSTAVWQALGLPMLTRCSLTEGCTRLFACGTRRRLLRSRSPPTPPGRGYSHPGQATRSLAQQVAHRRPHIRGVGGR
jgi:hypothetical protein